MQRALLFDVQHLPRHIRRVGAIAMLMLIAACVRNPAASSGPFPGYADYENRVVTDVSFSGNPILPLDSLRAILSIHPTDCRIAFLPRSLCVVGLSRYRLDLNDLAADIIRLQLHYRDHGYYGSRVVPDVEPTGSDEVAVHFNIDPGDEVILQSLTVDGMEDVVGDTAVAARLPLEVGGPFRRGDFLAAADSVRSILYAHGYAHASVLRNYSIDTIADVASADYVAVPGPMVTVDSVLIIGTDRLARGTVLQQLTFKKGQILQPPELARSQRNLYQLAIVNFAAVEMAADSLQVDADSSTATVAVRIVEASRYVTDTSLGYGTVDCLRAGVRATDRDFIGGGRTLELSASASKIGVGSPLDFGLTGSLCRGLRGDPFSDTLNYRLAADFLQPRLLGTRNQLTLGLHAEQQSEFTLYLRQSVGGQISLSRGIGRGALLGAGLQVEHGSTRASQAIFCVIFGACTQLEQQPLRDSRWSNAATLSASLDRTTGTGASMNGYVLRSSVAWASPWFLSDDRYLSISGDAAWYRNIRPGWVLAGRLQTGAFLGGSLGYSSNYIPPERRFYGGGPNSVRGFAPNALGPQAYVTQERQYNDRGELISSVQRYPVGGTQVAVGSLELRTPSPFLSQYMRAALFVDAGQVWAPSLKTRTAGVSFSAPIYVTPGFGFRITTPVGPIRIDVGYNPHGSRAGPLYLAQIDENGQPTGVFELLDPSYRLPRHGFLDNFQFHLAVGQAF